jgi:hypothetical protein
MSLSFFASILRSSGSSIQISAIVRRKLLPISVIESVQNYTEAGKTVQPCRTYVGQQSGVSRKLKVNEAPVSVKRMQLNLDWVTDFKILDCAIKFSFHRRGADTRTQVPLSDAPVTITVNFSPM